ncbi:hypothetical protein GN956_G20987 [Arapaima gigas]
MTTATSPILLKWDPKSLEIRTLTVERLLEPLVTQMGMWNILFKCLKHLNWFFNYFEDLPDQIPYPVPACEPG